MARKVLARGGEGAIGAEKSPGFRMRVDLDDGVSDPEPVLESSMIAGNDKKRKLEEIGSLNCLST